MTTPQSEKAVATAAAKRHATLAGDLLRLREDAGVSRAQLARASGVDLRYRQPVQPGDFEISAASHDGTEPAQTLWLTALVREGWLTSLELAYLEVIPYDFPSTGGFAAPSISG